MTPSPSLTPPPLPPPPAQAPRGWGRYEVGWCQRVRAELQQLETQLGPFLQQLVGQEDAGSVSHSCKSAQCPVNLNNLNLS